MDKQAIDVPRLMGYDAEGMPETDEIARQEKQEKAEKKLVRAVPLTNPIEQK